MTKTLQIATVRADRSDLAIGLDQHGERGLWMLSDGAPKFLCPVSDQDGLFFAIAADALGIDIEINGFGDAEDDDDQDQDEDDDPTCPGCLLYLDMCDCCEACKQPPDMCNCYCSECQKPAELCECL